MLSVSILHGALETYVKGVKSTQRATSPRASTFLALSQRTAVNCVEQVLWPVLGLCEGLAGDTVEQSQLETVITRSNEEVCLLFGEGGHGDGRGGGDDGGWDGHCTVLVTLSI